MKNMFLYIMQNGLNLQLVYGKNSISVLKCNHLCF